MVLDEDHLSQVFMTQAEDENNTKRLYIAMSMSSQDWVSVLQREYLQGYVREGGSAVKFVVGREGVDLSPLSEYLRLVSQHDGFLMVGTDADVTKVHLIDLLFHEIARQIDWDDLALQFLVKLFHQHNCHIPESLNECHWAALAGLNGRSEEDFRRDGISWIERALYQDYHMSLEFRLAMIQLCLARLEPEGTSSTLAISIKDWLRGELRLISALKEALIFQKVCRSNARHLITSLTHWIRLTGKNGLVVTMNIAAFLKPSFSKKSAAGLSYSVSAVLDAYEMLRQFIDGADEIAGLLMVVITPFEFLTNERLGVNRYEALKLRISDDVRDKYRQNPLAPLVRLSDASVVLDQLLLKESPTERGAIMHQRVIEALRSGVPNVDVVKTLGCPQATVKSKFQQLLHDAKDSIEKGWTTKGMLVEGGFGTGKSHLLECLQHMALEQQFLTSRVVISKETPLYSPALMFRAAIESAVIPDKHGEVLLEVAQGLQFQSPQYAVFSEWVNRQSGEIDARFAATLFLYERMLNDPELSHRIIRFWAGDPLSDAEIKRYLKACDSSISYRFDKLTTVEMAVQRFKFVSRLMIAAGYSGWILLIDEAEIVGRYSFKQRAQSYAELARWMGRLGASSFTDLGYKSGLASVLALTDDFQSAILDEKGDRESVPTKLRETGSEADLVLARQAEQGMQLIECERISLIGPHDELVEEIYHKIRTIHGEAYGWDPPHVPSIERLSSTRMREYVKGWITEWDLKRLAPDEAVEIELTEVKQDYSEDVELETVVDDTVQPVMANAHG